MCVLVCRMMSIFKDIFAISFGVIAKITIENRSDISRKPVHVYTTCLFIVNTIRISASLFRHLIRYQKAGSNNKSYTAVTLQRFVPADSRRVAEYFAKMPVSNT